LKISPQLAQAIIDYLKHRPYSEVFELIHGILQASQSERQEDESNQEQEGNS